MLVLVKRTLGCMRQVVKLKIVKVVALLLQRLPSIETWSIQRHQLVFGVYAVRKQYPWRDVALQAPSPIPRLFDTF